MRIVVDAMGGDNAPHEIVKVALRPENQAFEIELWETGLNRRMLGPENLNNKELL